MRENLSLPRIVGEKKINKPALSAYRLPRSRKGMNIFFLLFEEAEEVKFHVRHLSTVGGGGIVLPLTPFGINKKFAAAVTQA